ncbi:MAG: HEAT repeat domain-containing protein, partial [Verrucomicrobiales bacterium]|nr:HEAT repeat domain-containing protein [Verrucomicrobiales bacterium]
STTDGRYVYLRNYMPHLSQGQHVNYQFETPSTRVWRELYDAGKLNAAQSIFWSEPKAAEELYDLQSDPDEVNNLANSAEHAAILEKMRKAQRDLAMRVRDAGFMPEGELHSREPGTAPYDVAHSDEKYPLARILETSELASSMKVDATEELVSRLSDTDSAVRWWAALGLVMRDSGAVSSGHEALTKALTDESPDVRIAAAWALAKHGSDADRVAALPVLLAQADYSKSGVFSSIAALNAIGNIGDLAQSIHDAVIALPQSGPSPDGRYSGYPSRLLLDLGAKNTPAAKANKGKRKAKK